MSSSSASVFDSLPPRPPTPPKDLTNHLENALLFLDEGHEVERPVGRPSSRAAQDLSVTQTPPPRRDDVTSNGLKKVGFSPWPTYHNASDSANSGLPHAQPYQPSPPSRDRRPLKPILKASKPSVPLTPEDLEQGTSYFSPDVPGSFAKMLRSVLQQLASSSRTCRVDAYMAFNGALQAYDNVPDVATVLPKMDLIMQFLTRDMAWKDEDGNYDTNINCQSLRLTMNILRDRNLRERVDNDFKMFVVDRSIAVMQQVGVSKQVLKLQMHLLSQQSFGPHILTSAKADKIITVLNDVEQRCSGNNVVTLRLAIYRRLLDQMPGAMLPRGAEWLEHIFHGMLSSIKETRAGAIDAGKKAAVIFGVHPIASKILLDLLCTKGQDGIEYYDYFAARLAEMSDDKSTCSDVPPIWSIVVLFMRNSRIHFAKWPRALSWLRVLQKCLNTSDFATRRCAYSAWNKLVFVVKPDAAGPKNLHAMLRIPICTGLEKRGNDKSVKEHHQFALDSYYNLLHYTLRPGLTAEEYDRAWDLYIETILVQQTRASSKGRETACSVLLGILTKNTGAWNSDAALEEKPLKPGDLPKMEPRWVRSRLARILRVLEPVMLLGMRPRDQFDIPADEVWRHLMIVIGEAGSQEVKTSPDLKEAIAQLINFLHRLWRNCSRLSEMAGKDWYDAYVHLVSTMVEQLGHHHFTENILAATNGMDVQVAPTPSSHVSKILGTPQSPFTFLLEHLCERPLSIQDDGVYGMFLEKSVAACLRNVDAIVPKMNILDKSFQGLLTSGKPRLLDPSTDVIYAVMVGMAIDLIETGLRSQNEVVASDLTPAITSAVRILLTTTERLPMETSGPSLTERGFRVMFEAASVVKGSHTATDLVAKPFAEVLLRPMAHMKVAVKIRLVQCVLRSMIEMGARRDVQHSAISTHTAASIGSISIFSALIRNSMTMLYDHWDVAIDPIEFLNLLHLILRFLPAYCSSRLLDHIEDIQEGLIVWLEDKEEKCSTERPQLGQDASNLIADVIQLFAALPHENARSLKALEPLIIAAFTCRNRAVVMAVVQIWNDTFGRSDELQYPPQLESVLRARSCDMELLLPTFPKSDECRPPTLLPEFFCHEKDLSAMGLSEEDRSSPKKDSSSEDLENEGHRPMQTEPTAEPTIQKPIEIGVTNEICDSPVSSNPNLSNTATPKQSQYIDGSAVRVVMEDSSPIRSNDKHSSHAKHPTYSKAKSSPDPCIFPDFSSSPIAQCTAISTVAIKKLDLLPGTGDHDNQDCRSTPTANGECNTFVSDDPPSSPTPSSKAATPKSLRWTEEVDMEDPRDEPPSSPPREPQGVDNDLQSHHGERFEDRLEKNIEVDLNNLDPDEFSTYMDGSEMMPQERNDEDMEMDIPHVLPRTLDEIATPDDTETDETGETCETSTNKVQDGLSGSQEGDGNNLMSDSILPTAQLHLEEEAAAREEERSQSVSDTLVTTDTDRESGELECDVPRTRAQTPEEADPRHISQPQQRDANEVTEVETSFIGVSMPLVQVDSSLVGSGSNSNKKRKRGSPKVYVKKEEQKQLSPWKRVFGSFWRSSQQEGVGEEENMNELEDDEDIGENIVVASSKTPGRRATSPERPAVFEMAESERKRPEATSKYVARHDQVDNSCTKSLKRRASSQSLASTTNNVTGLLAPPRMKKQRKGLDTQRAATSTSSGQTSGEPPRRSSRRKVTEVAVRAAQQSESTPDTASDAREPGVEAEPEVAEPTARAAQGTGERAADAGEGRVVATHSILQNLRDALPDLQRHALTADEEREFDDVLFELRREVHEAARRRRRVEVA